MKTTLNISIPDFFIVGAAKSGTTSLWYYLGQHKDIFMTKDISVKELCLYSKAYGIKNIFEYSSFFKNAKENQLIGEACHAYLTSPESAKNIKNANPDAKIIISLRNPIKRAYSLYNWMKVEGYEDAKTFEDALKLELKRINDDNFYKNPKYKIYYRNYFYTQTGLYYEQIKRYYDVFGVENCHVLIFEDFIGNEKKEIGKILNFLGLSDIDFKMNSEPQNISKDVKSVTLQYFLKNNFDKYTYKFFIPQRLSLPIKRYIIKLNTKKKKPNALSYKINTQLKAFFKDDIEKTSRLIGIDLINKWIN